MSEIGMVVSLSLGVFVGNCLPILWGQRTCQEGVCIGAIAGVLTAAMMTGHFLYKNMG